MLVLFVEVSMGVPDASSLWFAGWCGTAMLVRASLAVEKSADGRITSGDLYRWEGPNAKPSVRTFVLVVVAVIAANPFAGLAGSVQR